MSYRYLASLLALGLVGCSNPTTDFDICRYDSKKTVLLVDLKRDLRALVGKGLCDAPGNRLVVRQPHDEPAFALHQII